MDPWGKQGEQEKEELEAETIDGKEVTGVIREEEGAEEPRETTEEMNE